MKSRAQANWRILAPTIGENRKTIDRDPNLASAHNNMGLL